MTRQEFEKQKDQLQKRIGIFSEIIIGRLSIADFAIGCYYNNEKNMWVVYENGERGIQYIRLETPSEDEAFDRLFSRIQFHIGIKERNEERDRLKKQEEQ